MVLQWLMVMLMGGFAAAIHLNTGFFGSLLIGVLPAYLLIKFLYGIMPRALIGIFTIGWAATGYSLVLPLTGEGGEPIFAALIFGGLGLAANFNYYLEEVAPTVAAAAVKRNTEQEMAAAALGADDEDDEDIFVDECCPESIARSLDHVLRAGALRWAVYDRAADKLPNGAMSNRVSRNKMPTIKKVPLSRATLIHLRGLLDAGVIPEEEFQKGADLVKSKLHLNDADTTHNRGREDECDERRAATQSYLAERSAEGDISHLYEPLADLTHCRAITIDAFKRNIPKIEPAYSIGMLTEDSFPFEYPKPEAKRQAAELLQAGMISIEEFEEAVKKINAIYALA